MIRSATGSLHERRQCISSGPLDLDRAAGGLHVEQTAEHAGEREHVVDLVRVVAAAGGDHRHVVGHQLGHDLRRRVGHREHDGIVGHLRQPFGLDDAGSRQAEEHVGALQRLADAAATIVAVAVLDEPLLGGREVLALTVQDAGAVDTDDVARAVLADASVVQQFGHRNTGGTGADDHHP